MHCPVRRQYSISISIWLVKPVFFDRFMPLDRNNCFACRPKICITNSILSINRRRVVLHCQHPWTITAADMNSDYFSCATVYGRSYPLFVVFGWGTEFSTNRRSHQRHGWFCASFFLMSFLTIYSEPHWGLIIQFSWLLFWRQRIRYPASSQCRITCFLTFNSK